MKATVLIERVRANKYRATTAQPIPLESEGASPDEALARLVEVAKKRLATGQLVELDLPAEPAGNPWQAYAGVWKDHPDFDAFVANVKRYRRSVNRRRTP
jgi:hypothetical protein